MVKITSKAIVPFVLVPISLLRSPGFQRLSPRAQILWVYMRANFNPYDLPCYNLATDREQVYISYSEIKKNKGFQSAATISKTIKELIGAGFIEIAEKGGLYGGRSAYYFCGKYAQFPKNWKKRKRFQPYR